MKKIKGYLVDILVLVASFLVCRWFFMTYLYGYMINWFGFPSSGVDIVRPLLVILGMTFILFFVIRSFYTGKLNPIFLRFCYSLYIVLLVCGLFLKNSGVRGFNISLVAFLKDMISIDMVVPFINLLLFLPLGILFSLKWKTVVNFILLVFLIEVVQYLFYLGFFDVGDIVTNTLGFVLGNALHTSRLGQKIREGLGKEV